MDSEEEFVRKITIVEADIWVCLTRDIFLAFSNRIIPDSARKTNVLNDPRWVGAHRTDHLIGVAWYDLDRQTIENYDFWLNSLEPDVFCYYLPSFLLASISDYLSGYGWIASRTISNLVPADPNVSGERGMWDRETLIRYTESLTDQEKKVVSDFVNSMRFYEDDSIPDISQIYGV